MKYTNKYGYPAAVVNAIENDSYSKGDSEFSASDLISPPRKRALERKHKDELEIDIDDRLFILYGHLGHAILERSAHKNAITEKRYFAVVDGTKISAQVDSLDLSEGVLIDWKFTTVYGFKKGTPAKKEWVRQMNIQLEILRQNGLDAKEMYIWGMLRDWRPKESSSKGYPNKMAFHKIEIWERAKTVEYISSSIKAHKLAEKQLPLCSVEENWHGGRCARYCEVSKFCEQYQVIIKTGLMPKE